MKVKQYRLGEDYPEICEWWRFHGWPEILTTHLSKVGFVSINGEGKKIAAAWLYPTGTAFYVFEFFVVNPEAGMKERLNGLKSIIDKAQKVVSDLGGGRLFVSTKTDSGLSKLLQKCGFTVGDTNMTNLIFDAEVTQ